jgi:hypothetical protein
MVHGLRLALQGPIEPILRPAARRTSAHSAPGACTLRNANPSALSAALDNDRALLSLTLCVSPERHDHR